VHLQPVALIPPGSGKLSVLLLGRITELPFSMWPPLPPTDQLYQFGGKSQADYVAAALRTCHLPSLLNRHPLKR